MSGSHTHGGAGNERMLWTALALTGTFMFTEAAAGFVTGSLALISDAAHMLTDAAALAIALAAVRVAKRAADLARTYGYHRFEILAAAFNALLLFGVAIYILVEAYARLRQPAEIQTGAMMLVAIVGLVVNVISMRLLSGGKDASLNIKGAYLEVWSDMLGSLGVIVGAFIIRFTGWTWVDPVIAVGIGLWVLPRTWVLLKESLNILLEGVPSGVEVSQIEGALAKVPGVRGVHDLHVWALTTGKPTLTAHVLHDPGMDHDALLDPLKQVLERDFGIYHSTLQLETRLCRQGSEGETYSAPLEPRTSRGVNA